MLKIIIVDDSQDDLMLAERVLRHCKILNPVHLLKSGNECIRYFEENSPAKPDSAPCILFLDLNMAPTSGVTVLLALREKHLVGESIIVILSGVTDIKLIQEGYHLGARSFLIKPFKAEDVVELLSSLKTKLRIEEGPEGTLLHWVSTSQPEQSSDTEILRRSGFMRTFSE